jgi:O-antigen/teichoic acid export membrane protein
MSIAKKAISGALWMSGISYIGFAINFAIQLILVRLLVPEDFGLFALGLSIAEILFIFFSFSFSMAVIQIQEAEDLFDTAFYLSIFSGILILTIGGIISIFISQFYPTSSVIAFFILCALQPLQGCSSIYSASMEKELQFKKNAIARGLATNISGFGAIFFAYQGYGVWSLVGREVISALLMLVGMRLFADYRFKGRFNKNTAKKLINFGYKMPFSRGSEIIYHRIPNFFIGTFAGTRALGLFSQTYYLANLPNTVLSPFSQNVAFATYSKIQGEKDKLNKAFYITNYFFIRLLIPLMLILFLYSKETLRILYGEKWLEGSSMLKYFAIYAVFLPLFSNIKILTYSLGRLSDVILAHLSEILLLSICIFIALCSGIIYLVAFGYSVSLLFGLFVLFYFLKKAKVKLYLKELFIPPAFISTIILFLGTLTAHYVSFLSNGILNLIFLIVILVILFLLFERKSIINNFRYVRGKMV